MELLQRLKEIATEIRRIEDEANSALYEEGNKSLYTDLLLKKTRLLVQLPQICSEETVDLSPETLSFTRDILGGISFSAEKALHLDSIFYMSALLYPEDYRDGENNDLENFIAALSIRIDRSS